MRHEFWSRGAYDRAIIVAKAALTEAAKIFSVFAVEVVFAIRDIFRVLIKKFQ
jgi:hypothetical protein